MIPLDIQGLEVRRGSQTVLENVSLRLDGPGLFGLVGPNGGGKSTLLSAICGLIAPAKGRVQVLGQSSRAAAPRLALVPQAAGFDRGFPITLRGMVETALLGPGLFGRAGIEGQVRVDAALTQTGVADLAQRPLSALSGDELQRGLIARALASRPQFLLLDEPTASVDQDHAERLFELLCDLGLKIPVLIVSHDLAQVAAYCDRVFCVNRHLWEAARHATAADLAGEIFTRPAHCARHDPAAKALA